MDRLFSSHVFLSVCPGHR